tara:strand:+ start:3660 stop:4124 length:465 start_codon:yes stop_codon:yes gene_type:complete
MRDLLELVFEYRRLLARSEATAGSLKPHNLERLEALEKLFGQEPNSNASYPRRHARCDIRRPATLRVGDRVQPVNLVNLGGGGVCITPAPNVKAGETALLRIVADDQSTVYQYRVRANWSSRSEQDSCMGMPFVGIPRVIERNSAAPRRAGTAN